MRVHVMLCAHLHPFLGHDGPLRLGCVAAFKKKSGDDDRQDRTVKGRSTCNPMDAGPGRTKSTAIMGVTLEIRAWG